MCDKFFSRSDEKKVVVETYFFIIKSYVMLYELNDYLADLYVQHRHIEEMWIDAICSFDEDISRLDEWMCAIMQEIIRVKRDMGL